MANGVGPGAEITGSTASTSLLQRVRQRDPAAWRRLVHLFSPTVYAMARGAGLQAADAADVVQEVFRAVARGLDGFRREQPGDSFRAWLRTIARNKIRDHYRRRQGQPQSVGGTDAQARLEAQTGPQDDLAAEPALENAELARALELVRAEFEPRTWEAFQRAAVDGEATADIAADLGISVNAVRKAKSRVLSRLREELKDLLD